MSEVKGWIAERKRIHGAATERLYFQHWGGQSQNGDYAESILFDEQTGDSLAYGLPDNEGEAFVDERKTLPVVLTALEKVLELHHGERDDHGYWTCRFCSHVQQDKILYPCATVRAVEGAINGWLRAECGIAKIKADALREAADATRGEAPGEPHAGASFISHARWLDERADAVEEQA